MVFCMRLLLTNDDGLASPGLKVLWRELKRIGEVDTVVPEQQQSATGKKLTFHKPLRYNVVDVSGLGKAYLVSGSPSDAVQMAFHEILSSKPDIVVSGINPGDNLSIATVLTSGTVSAAIEGSILGVPGVAFSTKIPDDYWIKPYDRPELFNVPARISAFIVKYVLEHGLPDGVDILNVNFPFPIPKNVKVELTRLARFKFENYVIKRRDPQGRLYYWLGGSVTSKMIPGTDLYAVEVNRSISITPISLDMTAVRKFSYFDDLKSDIEGLKWKG